HHLSRTHIIPISILLTRNLSHHLRRRRIPRIRLLHHRELHRVLSSITRRIKIGRASCRDSEQRHPHRRLIRPKITPIKENHHRHHTPIIITTTNHHLSRTHIIPISILLTRNLSHHLRRRRIPRIRLLHHRELHRVLSSITRRI